MKRYLGVICCALLISVASSIIVRAGYFTGPSNTLYMSAKAGTLWVEGTLSNDSAQHYKQVYSQAGNQGSFSSWANPTTHSVTHKNSRTIFEKDYAETKPCWKLSLGGNQICAW